MGTIIDAGRTLACGEGMQGPFEVDWTPVIEELDRQARLLLSKLDNSPFPPQSSSSPLRVSADREAAYEELADIFTAYEDVAGEPHPLISSISSYEQS
jgi:hypothetical protein